LETASIEFFITELASSGCYGNQEDFLSWLKAGGHKHINEDEFKAVFNRMVSSGVLEAADPLTATYQLPGKSHKFDKTVRFTVSSLHIHTPIQFARSRLDSFLQFHKVDPDEITIILIGATEGFENAVKYNSGKSFDVQFHITQNEFTMNVYNEMEYISVEDNIKAGKFDSNKTLMRGMLVMNKVFDFMDLNFSSDHKFATLVLRKNIEIY